METETGEFRDLLETEEQNPLAPQAGTQYQFAASDADVTIYGGKAGGGKSYGLILQPTRHLHLPSFGAVLFRRTYPELTNEGGLWDEAANVYPAYRGVAEVGRMRYKFPSGAKVSFRQMEHERDLTKWDGSQIALIEFDQLEGFTRRQFFYMFSRNRSTCGILPYIRATCNPQPNWLAEFLEWWIDQKTGYARDDRANLKRWFCIVGDEVKWGDTREELERRYAKEGLIPRSCRFIPASLQDNPALLRKDPGYLSNLMALSHVDRERLEKGNWKIRDSDGTEWPAAYFVDIMTTDWPKAFQLSAIAVDPSKGRQDGDPSAILFVGLASGTLWVDADIEHRPAERIIDDGVEMAMRCWPDAFGIESNGFQELLGEEYNRRCRAGSIPPLPMKLINNSVNKQVRIRRIGPYLRNGKIRIRDNPGGRILLEQLSGFPLPQVHDDGPDALEMAFRLMLHELEMTPQLSTRITV